MSGVHHQTSQVITFSRFTFSTRARKWNAFKKMGEALDINKVDGLEFLKKVGVGSQGGFSIWPNFNQYGWLAVWNNISAANLFFESNIDFLDWVDLADSVQTFYMKCKQYHGTWQGKEPFMIQSRPDQDCHIAVITRARVKPQFLIHFWRQVPGVEKKLKNSNSCDFALGFGEWPVVELATFSLWKSESDMSAFAYGSKQHKKAISDTRRLDWYSEEMFSRFYVFKIKGNPIDLPDSLSYLVSS